ncbi:MAG: MFS transporter, partial [Chloroflexi bacterium]
MTGASSRFRFPAAYRQLLASPQTRLLLAGLGVSSIGDGISTVTIAWLAVLTAPAAALGLFVGLAVAAYTLPGIIGALAFGRILRGRPARWLVLTHSVLRAACLSLIALLAALGGLTPPAYVALLAASSLMAAWGNAGKYTMLSAMAGSEGRFAVNSLASAQES